MLPTNRPIGVGIIGLSAERGWASLAHVPALRAMPECFAINGLCGSSIERADVAARVHGIAFATDDPRELAEHPGVDLVAVTVKVSHHRELVEHVIAAGKSVYCEWPLGRDEEEAEAMAAATAAGGGLYAFAGLQGRAVPELRHVRDLVGNGFVGEVISTSVLGAAGFPWGGMASKETAYALDRSTGATMLSIPFGHMIDSFTNVLGGFDSLNAVLSTRYPGVRLTDGEDVLATGPDQIAVNGVLRSGAVASVHYRGGDSPTEGFRWEITGTKGSLLIEGQSGHLQYGQVRVRGRQGDEPLQDLPAPVGYHRAGIDPGSFAYAVGHAYRAVHDNLTTGSSHAPTFNDAVATHQLLSRIEQASGWH